MSGPPSGLVADSPLARRNPSVKLGLVAAVSVVAMFVLDPVTPALLYLLALAGVAVSVRTPPRTLAVAHTPFVAFAAGLLVVNALSRPGAVLWQAGPLRITEQGLTVGTALAARTLLIGALAIGFLLSTDGVALMTSLHHNLRLGPRVTYAILAGYRMLQEMPREWNTIRHAHSVRREDETGRPSRDPRHLAAVVFTLLVVSIRKGERMAQALESRGLGLRPRSTWRPTPLTVTDALLAGVVLGTVALVLAVSAWLGTLEGPSALTG